MVIVAWRLKKDKQDIQCSDAWTERRSARGLRRCKTWRLGYLAGLFLRAVYAWEVPAVRTNRVMKRIS